MKYQSLRQGQHQVFHTVWPVAHTNQDYSLGYRQGVRSSTLAAAYFEANTQWRISGYLFSHTRVAWGATGWTVQVFYVGRRRRRVDRKLSRHPRWLQLVRTVPKWIHRDATPVGGGAWCWCRLPRVELGGLDAVMADLAFRLAGRDERRLKQVVLPLLKLTQRLPYVSGAHVRAYGRFTRRQRADHATHRWGTTHRAGTHHRVVDRQLNLRLRFGSVGLTVLVGYDRSGS